MNGNEDGMLKSCRGFTLTEVVVSAVVVGVAIAAVVATMRKSREIDVTFIHHHRARVIIDSCFESAQYSCENYSSIPTVSGASVLIDNRSGGLQLTGTLNISVALDSTVGTGNTTVLSKKCSATVSWLEPEGTQSVSLNKMVPSLQ
jgi:prepilin-type N-terminal cleavage/methylation domain-containing protein